MILNDAGKQKILGEGLESVLLLVIQQRDPSIQKNISFSTVIALILRSVSRSLKKHNYCTNIIYKTLVDCSLFRGCISRYVLSFQK